MSIQPLKSKNTKRIFHVLKDIFLYIIGVNLSLAFLGGILPKFFNFEKSIVINIFLGLVSLAAICWAIKWGVESALRKNKVYPNEYFKISVIIGAIPIFLMFVYVLIRIPSAYRFAKIVAPLPFLRVLFFALKEFTLGFISGLIYGTAVYFWFKKLSKRISAV